MTSSNTGGSDAGRGESPADTAALFDRRSNIRSFELARMKQLLPSLVSRCMAYSALNQFDDLLVSAVFRFYGLEVDVATAEAEILADDDERVRFFPWLLWDWRRLDAEATIGERFIREHKLSDFEQRLAEGLHRSRVAFYEVIEIAPPFVAVRELVTDKRLTVYDESLATELRVGRLFQGRVVTIDTANGPIGLVDAMYATLPASTLESVTAELRAVIDDTPLQLALEGSAPELIDFAERLVELVGRPPTFTNGDGDTLSLCRARLVAEHGDIDASSVAEIAAGLSAINGHEFTPLAPNVWAWEPEGARLGFIDLRVAGEVTVVANSVRRHRALVTAIEEQFGVSGPRLMSIEDATSAAERWLDRHDPSSWLEFDREVVSALRGWFGDWVERWMDAPHNALDSMTPRQAASDDRWRPALDEVINAYAAVLDLAVDGGVPAIRRTLALD